MESMKQELEEKIRKLEEDKQNMDISAGKIFELCSVFWLLIVSPSLLYKSKFSFLKTSKLS